MAAPWPAANAALLEVNEPGEADRYGQVASPGAAVWEGEVEAVLIRTRETVVTADGENSPVEKDALIVRKPAEAVATAKTGDEGTGYTVLVEDRRTATAVRSRFRIIEAEHRGRGESESARFELVDERPASEEGEGS